MWHGIEKESQGRVRVRAADARHLQEIRLHGAKEAVGRSEETGIPVSHVLAFHFHTNGMDSPLHESNVDDAVHKVQHVLGVHPVTVSVTGVNPHQLWLQLHGRHQVVLPEIVQGILNDLHQLVSVCSFLQKRLELHLDFRRKGHVEDTEARL